MRRRSHTPDGWLSIAFVVMVVLFALATVISQQISQAIADDSRGVVEEAAPSVRSLSRARSSLALEQLRLDDFLDAVAAGTSPSVQGIEQPWRQLNQALGEYQTLPATKSEAATWRDTRPELERVTRLRTRVLQLAANGHGAAAVRLEKSQLDPAMEDARAKIDQLITFNANLAAQFGENIHLMHERGREMAVALDGIAALITLAVAGMALRQARSSRRMLEQRNEELAARGVELEQFSGRMAHDVLSPLFTAGLGWDLACKLHPDDERLARIAETSRSAIRRSKRLVEDLLAFSLAGAKPLDGVRTDVATVVADVLANLESEAQEAQVHLWASELPAIEVACSAGVLTSILLNLTRNALKHMDQSERREIELRPFVAFGRFRCEVSDTGPGIPFEQQERIFEPYVRGSTRAAGIGLGLATVKRLVAAHGGRVGLRSTPGGGSTFWFELPLAVETEARPPVVH